MRKIYLILLICIVDLSTLQAQTSYTWSFKVRKITDKTYQIISTINVNPPWHTYSQFTPNGGPLPTKFTFTKNPLYSLEGPVRELGNMRVKHEAVFGVDVKYFDGEVEFTQKVKLKKPAKTNFTGQVEFMVCNDEQCLPPTTQKFTVALN